MAERITLDHVKNRLAHLQQLFPQFCETWKIDPCGNREYRVMDTAPKNQVQYPLGRQGKSAKELFNLMADSIEPLFQSMAKPLSVETVEIRHNSSEVAELAVNICNFLEDCDSADVVKLANSAFSKNYVLVVE
jgi:hypothetical protein